MKFIIGFILTFLSCFSFFAQRKVTLIFSAKYQNTPFEADKNYSLTEKDSFSINQLKFYISGIEFKNETTKKFAEKESFHLINLENKQADTVTLDVNPHFDFSKLQFNLGIDSTTHSKGVLGGDLDPTLGMYWTWQSGYINLKLEGKSTLCPTRNNAFSFHLGGYSGTNNALQKILLETQNQNEIHIYLDLNQVFSNINLTQLNQIMSPKKEAVELSKLIANSFRIE